MTEQDELHLRKIEYKTDIFRWSNQISNGTTVSISFGSVEVRNLSVPLVFQVKKLRNTLVMDPRRVTCTYFNSSTTIWSTSGVFMLGISMKTNHFDCASLHLTSFTANGGMLPPNLAVFRENPSVFRHYSPHNAYCPYFLGSFLFFSLLKII